MQPTLIEKLTLEHLKAHPRKRRHNPWLHSTKDGNLLFRLTRLLLCSIQEQHRLDVAGRNVFRAYDEMRLLEKYLEEANKIGRKQQLRAISICPTFAGGRARKFGTPSDRCGWFLPPNENIWASAFGNSVKSAQITLALGSGPNRCPMRPDSQFLEAYNLGHLYPHASVSAATLGHSRARLFNVVEISRPARVRDKFGETNSLNI